MTNDPEVILEFLEEISAGQDDLLDELNKLAGRRSGRLSGIYRNLVEQMIEEMKRGTLQPTNAENWLRDQIRLFVRNRQLEQQIINEVTPDLNRLQKFLNMTFDLLDEPFSISDAQIAARGRIGRYALDNGVKIGDRMAIQINMLANMYEGEEFFDLARSQIGTATSRLETVVSDIQNIYSREYTYNLSNQTGLNLWKYRKGISANTRFFCRWLIRLDYCYTEQQIAKMDNGHQMEVMTAAGGYRCVHGWYPGMKGWPGFENPYPEPGRFVERFAAEESNRVIIPQG